MWGILQFSQTWHWELTCKCFHLCSDFCYPLLELLFLLQRLKEDFQGSLGIKASLNLQGQHNTYKQRSNNEGNTLELYKTMQTYQPQQVRAHILQWFSGLPL